MILWFNGALHDENEPLLPANAAGLLLGWGVYSTLGIRRSRAIAAERHFARLRHNATALDIECGLDDDVLRDALQEIIARNAVESGIARLSLTRRGDGRWNRESGGDFTIMAHSAAPPPLNGLRLALSPYRLDARRALAGIKSTSLMEHQLAWLHAQRHGFDEALLCTAQGALCEGARSNIFWARGGELFTPSLECGCLPGIAREIVLEAAATLGIATHEGAFSLAEISGADEVFVTSATSGPRGVASLHAADEQDSFSAPGPLTQSLQQWWEEVALLL